MSPYCPTCLGSLSPDERRCPLDQQFPRRRSCLHCGAELYPRELYCAECGTENREPEEALMLPPAAGPRRQAGAILLDYFVVGLLVIMTVYTYNFWLALLLAPLVSLCYRAAGRCGGRQTFGQAVFHLLTVSVKAGPVEAEPALLRSFFELLRLPLMVAGRESAEVSLEARTATCEVSLV